MFAKHSTLNIKYFKFSNTKFEKEQKFICNFRYREFESHFVFVRKNLRKMFRIQFSFVN